MTLPKDRLASKAAMTFSMTIILMRASHCIDSAIVADYTIAGSPLFLTNHVAFLNGYACIGADRQARCTTDAASLRRGRAAPTIAPIWLAAVAARRDASGRPGKDQEGSAGERRTTAAAARAAAEG